MIDTLYKYRIIAVVLRTLLWIIYTQWYGAEYRKANNADTEHNFQMLSFDIRELIKLTDQEAEHLRQGHAGGRVPRV